MALMRIERGDTDGAGAGELRAKLREASAAMENRLKPLQKSKVRIDSNIRRYKDSAEKGPVQAA